MATTLRATVMLSVLVGLPAAWIYYGPLPPEAQQVFSRALAATKEALGWNKAPSPADAWVRVERPAVASKASSQSSTPVSAPPLMPPALSARELPQPQPPWLAERVEPALSKLRQLGAVEYALEHWGVGVKLFRFRCEMAVGASRLTQQFEAVTADPQRSIERVLAEVAAWQGGAQQSRVIAADYGVSLAGPAGQDR